MVYHLAALRDGDIDSPRMQEEAVWVGKTPCGTLSRSLQLPIAGRLIPTQGGGGLRKGGRRKGIGLEGGACKTDSFTSVDEWARARTSVEGDIVSGSPNR